MKIPELIDLINEFVFGKDLATEEKLNEKQKKSKASNIKRQYNMLIQNKKASGKKIQLRDLKKLIMHMLSFQKSYLNLCQWLNLLSFYY